MYCRTSHWLTWPLDWTQQMRSVPRSQPLLPQQQQRASSMQQQPWRAQGGLSFKRSCTTDCLHSLQHAQSRPVLMPCMSCRVRSVPVGVAAKLLQRQFMKDEALAWKFELVRWRDQLAKLEVEAQASCCRGCMVELPAASHPCLCGCSLRCV